MAKHNISIEPNTPAPGRHRVLVDGHDISPAVRNATIWLNPGELPELDLELQLLEAGSIDAAEATVTVPALTRDALIRLGWTPPAEDAP